MLPGGATGSLPRGGGNGNADRFAARAKQDLDALMDARAGAKPAAVSGRAPNAAADASNSPHQLLLMGVGIALLFLAARRTLCRRRRLRGSRADRLAALRRKLED